MTRETKIGLLVGLSFIIVIGILLSDHLTTRGELPAAQLTQVGDNVRKASTVPASSAPPITPVTIPTNFAPLNPVPTSDELHVRPPTTIVQVGPSPVVSIPVIGATTASDTSGPVVTVTPTPDNRMGQPLMGTADNGGTPAVIDPPMQPVARGQTPADAIADAKNLKSVKAEKGDTVSHLAAKYLGANTNANRQLIIDANPALKADPAKIIIGRTYLIPTKAAVASVPDAPAIPDTVPTNNLSTKPEVKTVDAKPAASAKTTSTYTVKSNDSLWSIANGSPSVIKEIQELNKDILKGKTTVHPGTVLKVPAKTTIATR